MLVFELTCPISMLQRVDDILQFIADSTVNVEGVGHVCRLVFLLCSDLLFWHGSTLVAFSYVFIDNFFLFLLYSRPFGSFSVFDFQKHGNSNYGSPHNAPRTERSSQGKMEKSFLRYDRGYISCRIDIIEVMKPYLL
jgi:autophagy-related protein 9